MCFLFPFKYFHWEYEEGSNLNLLIMLCYLVFWKTKGRPTMHCNLLLEESAVNHSPFAAWIRISCTQSHDVKTSRDKPENKDLFADQNKSTELSHIPVFLDIMMLMQDQISYNHVNSCLFDTLYCCFHITMTLEQQLYFERTNQQRCILLLWTWLFAFVIICTHGGDSSSWIGQGGPRFSLNAKKNTHRE